MWLMMVNHVIFLGEGDILYVDFRVNVDNLLLNMVHLVYLHIKNGDFIHSYAS